MFLSYYVNYRVFLRPLCIFWKCNYDTSQKRWITANRNINRSVWLTICSYKGKLVNINTPIEGLRLTTLRSNPYLKATDLFCSRLFNQLEDFHLGVLLRLWIWLGEKIIFFIGFSRVVVNLSSISKMFMLYQVVNVFTW